LCGFHAPHFDGARVRTTPLSHALLTGDNPGAFFYFPQPRLGPDMQNPDNLTNPTPIERHLPNLLFHCRQTARVGIATDECSTTGGTLLTAKPFLAIARLAILHHRFTLTMWTLDRCFCHRLSLLLEPSLLMSTNGRHNPQILALNRSILTELVGQIAPAQL